MRLKKQEGRQSLATVKDLGEENFLLG